MPVGVLALASVHRCVYKLQRDSFDVVFYMGLEKADH